MSRKSDWRVRYMILVGSQSIYHVPIVLPWQNYYTSIYVCNSFIFNCKELKNYSHPYLFWYQMLIIFQTLERIFEGIYYTSINILWLISATRNNTSSQNSHKYFIALNIFIYIKIFLEYEKKILIPHSGKKKLPRVKTL